jgi:hypothetical protein
VTSVHEGSWQKWEGILFIQNRRSIFGRVDEFSPRCTHVEMTSGRLRTGDRLEGEVWTREKRREVMGNPTSFKLHLSYPYKDYP